MPTARQRRAAQQRRAHRQQLRRYQRWRRRRRYNLIATIAGVLVLVAVVLVFFLA